ncbi:IS1 family transposase [Polyangium sorediatum]|uniref:IS1 family transposase n=1 Tax=Polyangium sorediatum TaxID=889274 RepID=A0ABT6NMU1_9BACT|nr:IS1 family transposase [Polyangium sorediatum]MDI1429618.1 IS1 family transposase [Polyangium sorediatum]
MRSTSRLTGTCKEAILSLLVRIGEGCDRLHNQLVHNLDIREIQCDEIWSFVHTKQARVKPEDPPEYGDAYAYLALARTKKLIVSYRVGKRDEATTKAFVADLRARLVTIPEVSTDGWQSYPTAIGQSFGGSVDHAVIQKNYSKKRRADGQRHDHRYEPPRDPFITKRAEHGAPDLDRASTSHVERANLTVRMHIRRFTRLCNGFSRKIENHRAAISLHVAFYNFVRVHEALRVTPAMEAGITSQVWTVEELVERALAAAPCDPPKPRDLAPPAPTPGEKQGAARKLPDGKGWLRVIDGGKAKPSEAPKPPPPPVPVRYPTPRVDDYEAHWQQMDLFLWKQKERRLAFFDDPEDDE